MTNAEVRAACKLLSRCETSIYALLREARAAGQPRTIETLATRMSPLCELGYMVFSGKLELTSAGQQQFQAWKTRHGIGG